MSGFFARPHNRVHWYKKAINDSIQHHVKKPGLSMPKVHLKACAGYIGKVDQEP